MEFIKMQGSGNDYLFLNCLDEEPADLPGLAVRMSDRHFGAGSDGLICLCPSERGDFRMRMFNADGSEGEMCGNGIRCLAKYIRDCGLSKKSVLDIETGAGLRQTELLDDAVRVDIGPPRINKKKKEETMGRKWRIEPETKSKPKSHLI